jgi:hypothetical protein
MTGATFTAEDFLRDIFEAEASLRGFEQKYGLLSETFHRLYREGQLRDEDPGEIQQYLEWASWFDVYQDRRRRYDEAVQKYLRTVGTPASLADLHFDKLPMPN